VVILAHMTDSLSETPRQKPQQARGARSKRRTARNNQSLAVAVRAVEKRLTAALKERDGAARDWSVVSAKLTQIGGVYNARDAEVKSLVNTLAVLRGQQQPMGYPPGASPALQYPSPRQVTMEQVMSDHYIAPQPPPLQPLVPSAALAPSPYNVPIPELPFTPGRGGGAAMDTALAAPEADEDEHLKASEMNSGQWV